MWRHDQSSDNGRSSPESGHQDCHAGPEIQSQLEVCNWDVAPASANLDQRDLLAEVDRRQ
jgi:hypothetical protein